MKKLFFLATFAVALVLTGCGNGLNKLPKDLREKIEELDEKKRADFEDFDEYREEWKKAGIKYTYDGVKVKDKDIIFTYNLHLSGDSKTEEIYNSFAIFFPKSSYAISCDLDDETEELLVKYEYNVIYRLESNFTDEPEEGILEYTDL